MIFHRRRALLIAGVYLIVGVLYILLSGRLAATIAPDILELAQIETIKGVLFVLFTAIGIFLFAQWQLREVAREATDLLDHRDALLVSERRVIAGTASAAGAYVINTHVNRALAACEKLSGMVSAPEAIQQIQEGTSALSTLKNQVSGIRDAALSEIAGREQEIDLIKLLESSIEIARLHGIVRHCAIELTGSKSLNAFVYPALVHSMVVNLLINAAEATGGHGKIEIHVRNDQSEVVVEVHDNGPGILSTARDLIFAPFYTTKPERAGLGLLAVHACVEAHGGRVDVFTSHLGGARFDVVFPGTVRTT